MLEYYMNFIWELSEVIFLDIPQMQKSYKLDTTFHQFI